MSVVRDINRSIAMGSPIRQRRVQSRGEKQKIGLRKQSWDFPDRMVHNINPFE